jgi:hypothetical protein
LWKKNLKEAVIGYFKALSWDIAQKKRGKPQKV